MNRLPPWLLPLLLVLGTSPAAQAQNVVGYAAMTNPYLLLLREPAVLADLQLTEAQRRDLRQLNDDVDGPLLALRNKSADQANTTWEQLLQKTEAAADKILTAGQRQRLSQIMLRVRGVKLVLTPQVAKRLKLSADQKSHIEKVIDETAKEVSELQTQQRSGGTQQNVGQAIQRARERERKQVLAQLTNDQTRTLSAILGRSFDPNRLGRVSFKAPELADAAGWINSEGLRLAELRGKVVVLHFWTFG